LRAKLPANVAVHALAIADRNGEMEFQHVVSNAGYSGLRRRTYPSAEEEVRPIRVRVSRLDDALPADLSVTAMKVDVEGAELQVFQGARRILGTLRPWVLFEHGRGAADCYGTSPEMVYDLLAEHGYRIALPADWLEGRASLDRAGFVGCFGTENCNFLAVPSTSTNGGR
jgi:FkbM family methyltransferase